MREESKKFITVVKNIKWQTWALLFLILVGIFLRTYHFHDWLDFRGDQVRDAYLVDAVVSGKTAWPLLGPKMNYTEEDNGVLFHVGPIYYYFQIISAKIFGSYPDKLAYPDLFFSILSIPLFYYFLRIYFSRNLSLVITGLYSISFYFIVHSRYAWNTNLIPFFALLFLFSLYKILSQNEKTHWIWVVLLGLALGIGVQIHIISLILFSSIAFICFVFSIKTNSKVWKKWAAVLLLALVLNTGQIINEFKTDFSNTRSFLNLASQNNKVPATKFTLLKNDIDCHVEANFFFLSSYGGDSCSYNFSNLADSPISQPFKNSKREIYVLVILISLLFSILGYYLFFYYDKKETIRDKKYFLRILIMYAAINFLIILPLSNGQFNDLRYFAFGFFVPYMFLGMIINFLSQRFASAYIIPAAAVIILLIISNFGAIFSEVSILVQKNETCSHSTTLGEIEPVADYIFSQSKGYGKIYIGGSNFLTATLVSLAYLAQKEKINLIPDSSENDLISGNYRAFYINCRPRINGSYSYQQIGRIYVFDLNNPAALK